MATKLRTFDFSKASNLTQSTEKGWAYPWEQWLDGDIWQLTEGEDFQTHPLMMERIIRTRATSRKAKVRIKHLPLSEDAEQPFGILVVQRTDVVGPTQAKKDEQKAAREAKKATAAVEAEDLLAKAGIKPKAVNGAKPSKTAKAPAAEVAAKPSKTPSKRPAKQLANA
jgi:hypothetical protein